MKDVHKHKLIVNLEKKRDNAVVQVRSHSMNQGQKNKDKELYQTLKVVRKSLLNQPRNTGLIYKKGYILYLLRKYEMAADAFSQAIQVKPEFVEAYNARSIVNHELGKFTEAIHDCERALKINPKYKESVFNLARSQQSLNQCDKAIQNYTKAISLDRNYLRAFLGRAESWKSKNDLEKAVDDYSKALSIYPSSHITLLNRGVALKQLEKFDDAVADYQKAILLKPDFVEAHTNLGNTLQEMGKIDQAKRSFSRAISLQPSSMEAHLYFFEFLERTNDVGGLLAALDKVKPISNRETADFLFYKALAYFRKERHEEALKLISQIVDGDISDIRKAKYYKLKGDLLHNNRDYGAAFIAYKASNDAVKESTDYQRQKDGAKQYFQEKKHMIQQLSIRSKQTTFTRKIDPKWQQPTFLIGFPRSGTTLLDNILSSHSRIDVVEEQPMLARALSVVKNPQELTSIEQMDEITFTSACKIYLEELEKHVPQLDQSTVIDKLPLNILELPVIKQLFPNAKFIFAVRHPLDCILSCWMQTFKLNPAMANMLDLSQIVDFYCMTMECFQLSKKRYQLDVHRVRYEDLVVDFKSEVSSVLSFLSLSWEDKLLNYQRTAQTRKKIFTPSYSQVIKPIYKSASYRWTHYESCLEDFKPLVQPWIDEYGY